MLFYGRKKHLVISAGLIAVVGSKTDAYIFSANVLWQSDYDKDISESIEWGTFFSLQTAIKSRPIYVKEIPKQISYMKQILFNVHQVNFD